MLVNICITDMFIVILYIGLLLYTYFYIKGIEHILLKSDYLNYWAQVHIQPTKFL